MTFWSIQELTCRMLRLYRDNIFLENLLGRVIIQIWNVTTQAANSMSSHPHPPAPSPWGEGEPD